MGELGRLCFLGAHFKSGVGHFPVVAFRWWWDAVGTGDVWRLECEGSPSGMVPLELGLEHLGERGYAG